MVTSDIKLLQKNFSLVKLYQTFRTAEETKKLCENVTLYIYFLPVLIFLGPFFLS